MSRGDWTPDKIRMLVRLAGNGLTGSEIAGQIGFSRCAVMGKCWRLGIRLNHGQGTADRLRQPAMRERQSRISLHYWATRRGASQ